VFSQFSETIHVSHHIVPRNGVPMQEDTDIAGGTGLSGTGLSGKQMRR
jgi:hypothetical protein